MASTAGEKTEQRQQFITTSTRTIAIVKLGEVTNLPWGKPIGEKQTWAKLSVEEIK